VKFIPSHVSFISKSSSEKCIKSVDFLTKLQTKICWLLFMAHGVVLLFQLVLVLFVCRALSVSAVLQAFLPKINFIYGVVACLHPLSLYQSLCLPALVHATGQCSLPMRQS